VIVRMEELDLADAARRRAERIAAEEARRRKLHADGYSDAQIDRAMGGSLHTVRNWRQRAGLPGNGTGVDL
jgi:transposase